MKGNGIVPFKQGVDRLGQQDNGDKCPDAAGEKNLPVQMAMPSTKGVYSPRGISNVEKLIPGAITLSARQKPQKRYHTKFGVIVTAANRSPSSSAKITAIATISEI